MDDLFPGTPRTIVRLDRAIDRQRPCCQNLATIHVGSGPHLAALRCAGCGLHRGWLPREAEDFLKAVAEQFGPSTDPIILRDQTIGDHVMKKYDDSNRGVLFKNDGDNAPDYKGTINIGGVEHWLNAWIKESQKAGKYMSLSVRPKEEKAKPAVAKEFNDDLPWVP